MALATQEKGETGTVSSINSEHGRDRIFERRLMDMSFTPCTLAKLVKSVSFHPSIEIHVPGSRLALGRVMAERIFTEKKEK